MQLVAKILYDEILKDNAGLYIWVTPAEQSMLTLNRLCQMAPFKTFDGTELHCTVMHCKGPLPSEAQMPLDGPMSASITGLNHWIDHKGRNIIVIALDSPDLQASHALLSSQEITHGYPEYNPHITIAKDIEIGAEQRLWLAKVNDRLSQSPVTIAFDPKLRATSLS